MKRTISLILMMSALLLFAMPASAETMTAKELIEQRAVPMARENDTGVQTVDVYSPEQLRELARLARENGVAPEENEGFMLAAKRGESYWEEEAIMEICREAFGGLFYEWTIEEQHWFQEMVIRIGFAKNNPYCLPEQGDMTVQEARAHAAQALEAEYGEKLPLFDEEIYRQSESFVSKTDAQDNPSEPEWSFEFFPKDLIHPTCAVSFDRRGNVLLTRITEQDWSSYTIGDLINGISSVYSYRTGVQSGWDAEAWYVFGQMLPGALKQDEHVPEFEGYAMSVYLLPGEGDMTQEEAVKIAAQREFTEATLESAVLLGDDARRIWKITLSVQKGNKEIEEKERVSFEIDSRSGEVLSRLVWTDNHKQWARYMLDRTYEQVSAGMMTAQEAIRLAQEALWTKLKDESIPFGDLAVYETECRYSSYGRSYNITFNTRALDYGTCNVQVNEEDGEVRICNASTPGVTGDTLYARYREVYGSQHEWDQALWRQFGEALDGMEVSTFEAKLLQMTVYPDLTEAALTRDEAIQIALGDIAQPSARIHMAVLLGSKDSPVWKIRVLADPADFLYEIDAMTGNVLDREAYKPDNPGFDHPIKLCTLRSDYAPAAAARDGIEHAAAVEVSKAYADMRLDDPMLPVLDESLYCVSVHDLTVTFTALEEGLESYSVTFDETYRPIEIHIVH